MAKQPKPMPMKKTKPKMAASGKLGAPDMKMGGKPLGPVRATMKNCKY